MLSIFQHFHAIPLRSPLISLRSKWRLTGFSRRFTPKYPVRLHKPFGQLPRWGAKNVLPLNLIALPRGEGCDTRMRLYPKHSLEGKEEAASPQKRKPTPPRCARQPLPREGARVDTPSFRRKEVPRRGGGWMGEAVFLCPSLPRVGNAVKLSGIHRVSYFFNLST